MLYYTSSMWFVLWLVHILLRENAREGYALNASKSSHTLLVLPSKPSRVSRDPYQVPLPKVTHLANISEIGTGEDACINTGTGNSIPSTSPKSDIKKEHLMHLRSHLWQVEVNRNLMTQCLIVKVIVKYVSVTMNS